jgi:hypothetical protein
MLRPVAEIYTPVQFSQQLARGIGAINSKSTAGIVTAKIPSAFLVDITGQDQYLLCNQRADSPGGDGFSVPSLIRAAVSSK